MIGSMLRLNCCTGKHAVLLLGARPLSTSATSLVAARGSVGATLYTGPLNELVSKVKRASLASSGVAVLGTPLGLHYLGPESWSWASNLFFLLGGNGDGGLSIAILIYISLQSRRLVHYSCGPLADSSRSTLLESIA